MIGGGTAALALRAGSVSGGLAPPARVVPAGREQPMVTTHEFDDVFRSSYPRLVRLLTATTDDAEVAADCVQEAFVRAHVRWRRIGEYDDPVGWVRRVALNLARDHARRAARKRKAKDRLAVEGEVHERSRAPAEQPVDLLDASAQPPATTANGTRAPLRRGAAGARGGVGDGFVGGRREVPPARRAGAVATDRGRSRRGRAAGMTEHDDELSRALGRSLDTIPVADSDAALARVTARSCVVRRRRIAVRAGASLAVAAVIGAVWLGARPPGSTQVDTVDSPSIATAPRTGTDGTSPTTPVITAGPASTVATSVVATTPPSAVPSSATAPPASAIGGNAPASTAGQRRSTDGGADDPGAAALERPADLRGRRGPGHRPGRRRQPGPRRRAALPRVRRRRAEGRAGRRRGPLRGRRRPDEGADPPAERRRVARGPGERPVAEPDQPDREGPARSTVMRIITRCSRTIAAR